MMIITVDFEDRVVIVLVDWLAWGFIPVFTESLKNVLDQVPGYASALPHPVSNVGNRIPGIPETSFADIQS